MGPIIIDRMIERLVHALIATRNEASDGLLLRALDLGNAVEKQLALGALIKRGSVRGLGGVIDRYEELPDRLKLAVLEHLKEFGAAISEWGRSPDNERRLAAMKLIALGRQAKLGYVLLENLAKGDERLQRGAVEAVVALARWAAMETRSIQRGAGTPERVRTLVEQRAEIDDLVYKALDRQKGTFGGELTRAALLVADWRGSKTMEIVKRARHPGRGPMERRLAQPPESEHLEAWLVGAAYGGVRTEFAGTFAHLYERPVLDGLLRKAHWVKDLNVQVCMSQVMGGRWMDDVALGKELKRRTSGDVAGIAQWVGVSGCAEVVKDALLARLKEKGKEDVGARLAVMRVAMARPREASVAVLKSMLSDPDEQLRRMAAREIIRRKPAGYQNMLMGSLDAMMPTVRQVIGRAVGEAGFRAFWKKYDKLDDKTRKSAGRAVVKILPDATRRVASLLTRGSSEERVRAIRMARETELIEGLRPVVERLCKDHDANVRSSAVSAAGDLRPVPAELLVDRATHDGDPRVRSNAIETLESTTGGQHAKVFAERVGSEHARERATAIKALYGVAPGTAVRALGEMLRDGRAQHRVSALWAVNRVKCWQRLGEVGRIAKEDPQLSVRQYALGVLKAAADEIRQERRVAV